MKTSDRLIEMKRLVLALIFCSSCQQGPSYVSNWWGAWKDYTITQLASQSAKSSLDEEERYDLLYLFEDLIHADSCNERQELIENNETLKMLGRQYDLPRGYLFDVLFNYDYEKAITNLGARSVEEKTAFTVVNVWKTTASIEQINQVIRDISKCYPEEYVD